MKGPRNAEGRKDIYNSRALVYREVGRVALLKVPDEVVEMLTVALLGGDTGTFLERTKSDERVFAILDRIEAVDRLPLPNIVHGNIKAKPLDKGKVIKERVAEAVKNSGVKGKTDEKRKRR